MAELLLGAGAAAGLIGLVHYAQTRSLAVTRWQWALTLLAFLYWIFVAAVVLAFLREGSPQGAAVMGAILGFIGVAWAVPLGRFVFARKRPAATTSPGARWLHRLTRGIIERRLQRADKAMVTLDQASGYGRQVPDQEFWKMYGRKSITAREKM